MIYYYQWTFFHLTFLSYIEISHILYECFQSCWSICCMWENVNRFIRICNVHSSYEIIHSKWMPISQTLRAFNMAMIIKLHLWFLLSTLHGWVLEWQTGTILIRLYKGARCKGIFASHTILKGSFHVKWVLCNSVTLF